MPPGGLGSGREVAESCLELLLVESAAHFSAPGAAQPAKAALESIGFQVGLQLVERCVATWVTRHMRCACAARGCHSRSLST
jgi:hypothetical protein